MPSCSRISSRNECFVIISCKTSDPSFAYGVPEERCVSSVVSSTQLKSPERIVDESIMLAIELKKAERSLPSAGA
eukprot:6181212-Pleurochrysis_carterae.AAC.2